MPALSGLPKQLSAHPAVSCAGVLYPNSVLSLQIEVLNEYSASLQAVHRKQEVRQIKAEIAHLQSPASCAGCAVSLAALRLPGL